MGGGGRVRSWTGDKRIEGRYDTILGRRRAGGGFHRNTRGLNAGMGERSPVLMGMGKSGFDGWCMTNPPPPHTHPVGRERMGMEIGVVGRV